MEGLLRAFRAPEDMPQNGDDIMIRVSDAHGAERRSQVILGLGGFVAGCLRHLGVVRRRELQEESSLAEIKYQFGNEGVKLVHLVRIEVFPHIGHIGDLLARVRLEMRRRSGSLILLTGVCGFARPFDTGEERGQCSEARVLRARTLQSTAAASLTRKSASRQLVRSIVSREAAAATVIVWEQHTIRSHASRFG